MTGERKKSSRGELQWIRRCIDQNVKRAVTPADVPNQLDSGAQELRRVGDQHQAGADARYLAIDRNREIGLSLKRVGDRWRDIGNPAETLLHLGAGPEKDTRIES